MRKTILALATLIGTMIGAGILGIPYVVMKSGFAIGLIHIFVIAFLIMITMLYLGEIALRTNHSFQLTGYAEKYLGKKGKLLMIAATVIGVYSALIAYLIGQGESLSHLIHGSNNDALRFALIGWMLLALLARAPRRFFARAELIGVSSMIILMLAIVVRGIPQISLVNLAKRKSPDNFHKKFRRHLSFLVYSRKKARKP